MYFSAPSGWSNRLKSHYINSTCSEKCFETRAFVDKHLLNKHAEAVRLATAREEAMFNNYVRDGRRVLF